MKKFLIFILVVMVILLSGYIVYDKVIVVNNNQPNSSNKDTSDNNTNLTNNEKETTTSTITGEENVDCSYKNEFGDGTQSLTVKNAIQCQRNQGFAGASSHVYYLNTEHVFYHLSLVDLSVTELAKGIDKFEINMNGDVIAYYNSNYSKTNDNQYVIYKDSNDSNVKIVECSYKNEFGDGTQSITIKNAIQCKSGQGFAGASSHVYYLDTEHVFYHLSLVDLSITELAKGIDRFEINLNGDVIAYYNSNYSKTNDNQYVIYKNS